MKKVKNKKTNCFDNIRAGRDLKTGAHPKQSEITTVRGIG